MKKLTHDVGKIHKLSTPASKRLPKRAYKYSNYDIMDAININDAQGVNLDKISKLARYVGCGASLLRLVELVIYFREKYPTRVLKDRGRAAREVRYLLDVYYTKGAGEMAYQILKISKKNKADVDKIFTDELFSEDMVKKLLK
jgi:hypothetical protein